MYSIVYIAAVNNVLQLQCLAQMSISSLSTLCYLLHQSSKNMHIPLGHLILQVFCVEVPPQLSNMSLQSSHADQCQNLCLVANPHVAYVSHHSMLLNASDTHIVACLVLLDAFHLGMQVAKAPNKRARKAALRAARAKQAAEDTSTWPAPLHTEYATDKSVLGAYKRSVSPASSSGSSKVSFACSCP